MSKRLAVIVSQGPGSNPVKRQLEEDIVTGLMFSPNVEVTVIPNLYDLRGDSTGMLALQGIAGDMVVCSWMFERAAHWILDRNGMSGRVGTTLLTNDAPDDEDEDEEDEEAIDAKPRVNERREIANRWIYCLDLRTCGSAQAFIDEVLRIQSELNVRVVRLGAGPSVGRPTREQLQRFESPTNSTGLARNGSGLANATGGILADAGEESEANPPAASINRIEESSGRRWYPVIDYSRCTNCLECIDFCLFGVYGIDRIDTILVEQPDNCRKGCPACSRVCPENAIIFPQHKTPAIAGSAEVGASLKIDLSQLFGAPAEGKSAEEIAALERDEQLVLAGRDAVGMQGLEKRRPARSKASDRDELDDLVDRLDQLNI